MVASQPKKSQAKSRKRKVPFDLGNIAQALERNDEAFLIEYFKAGYTPEKTQNWMRMIVDLDRLNEKYYLWKDGL